MPPTFSVITPSFRQLEWLKLSAASVADQEGTTVEHIVQDAGTGPELESWATGWPGLALHVEKDEGMYDAINRGLKKSTGKFLGYLNCDEQYLPGTLAAVESFFESHPEVDVVFGDAIVVDDGGNYLCSRQVLLPTLYHTWVCNLPIFTAATFFRRRIVADQGVYFPSDWEIIGDSVWTLQLIRRGIRMAALDRFASVFTETGENLSGDLRARPEKQRLLNTAPSWVRKLRPLWLVLFRLRRLWKGHYWPKPFTYAIYTREHPAERSVFKVSQPSFRWKSQFHIFAAGKH
jgi:glycosyltransferase involved in cell wall biosynthesis